MNTELVTATNNVPSTQYNQQKESVLASDITIPKILQMQPLSDWVTEGKAKSGDFVRSSSVQVVGGKDKALEFIPLSAHNLWMLSVNENGDGRTYTFKGYEPRNASNEYSEWEFFKDGVKWKRTKVMHLFALLPSDIEAQLSAMKKYQETGEMPDLESALMPVVIPFRNTSFKAAKEVATLFLKAEMLATAMKVDVPVFGRTMKLCNYLEKNDKGSFYVLKVEASGPTKKEYLAAAKEWTNTLRAMEGNIKIDDAEPVVKDANFRSEEVPF